MAGLRFSRQALWSAREFGVNGAALSASTTSNAVAMQGNNQVTLFFNHSANTSGALTIVAYLEESPDNSTWYAMTTKSISAGAETVSTRYISWTVAAADTISYSTGIDSPYFRLTGITAAGAAATDLLSISISRGHTG